MSEPNYDEIRNRVLQRFNKRKELFMHLAAYLLVNVVLWFFVLTGFVHDIPVLNGIYEGLGILLPIAVSIGWGIGVFIHYLDYYYEAGGGAERRERAIAEAIEREKALRSEYEKPKRDPRMQLTEDGEIEEVLDDEYDARERRR
ncbi:MAG: 2TM domain-containing protein [Anaerolineae bacterium]|nr:2TM domain-containing protein [Anaerolineae bacterium]